MKDFEPPAEVRPDKNLGELASEINAAHRFGAVHCARGLDSFRKAGELLAQAKKRVGHGRWIRWVKKHLEFGERQAQKYMRLACEWGRLANTNSGSLLDGDVDVNGAMRLLSEKEPQTVEVVYEKPAPAVARPVTVKMQVTEAPAEPVVVNVRRGEDDCAGSDLTVDPAWVGDKLCVPQQPKRLQFAYKNPDGSVTARPKPPETVPLVDALMRAAVNELRSVRGRYKHLAGLAAVWAVIDELPQ